MKNNYKTRRAAGADRYGVFHEGQQRTPDIIAGVPIWHKFKCLTQGA